MKVRIALLIVLSLAVCSLLPTQVLNAKDLVTRPFQISGQLTIMDYTNPAPPWVMIDRGVALEFGKFVDVGKYEYQYDSVAQEWRLVGYGIFYVASGDQIFWKDDGSHAITFTGGTGRFQNVSGEFMFWPTDSFMEPGPEGTTSFVFNYYGEGTITY